MNVRSIVAKALFLGILWLAGATSFHAVASDTPFEVKFRVFNERGTELTHKQVVARMTGNRPRNLSAGTVDLATLKAITLNENFDSAGTWTMPFNKTGQGLVVHWNTESTGYSTFLLDNGGKGFQKAETVVFNQRLAEDAKRQFDDARAARRDHRPSEAFSELARQVESCFADLRYNAVTPTQTGSQGQRCLDRVAQAMNLLLQEYGAQRAATLGDAARWGVTIVPEPARRLSVETKKIDDLTALFAQQHRWARIAMSGDGSDDLGRIYAIAAYAASRGVKTMGQLFDSSDQADVPLDMFKARVDEALAYQPPEGGVPLGELMTAWEVGNEVNGSWLGQDVPEKIKYAAHQVKDRWPDKDLILTFYWSLVESELDDSLFNWIDTNVDAEIVRLVEQVALSVYVDQQPLNFSWDLIMSKLSARFPGKPVMSGELAYERTSHFAEGAGSWSARQRQLAFIRSRYLSSFATPGSIGGGFWWYYDDDMVGRNAAWLELRNTYCAAYPALCGR